MILAGGVFPFQSTGKELGDQAVAQMIDAIPIAPHFRLASQRLHGAVQQVVKRLDNVNYGHEAVANGDEPRRVGLLRPIAGSHDDVQPPPALVRERYDCQA